MPERAGSVWEQAGLRLPLGDVEHPDDHVDALQLALNQRLGELALVPETDPGYAAACDEVFAAGLSLVGAENRLPVLLAEQSWRLSRWLLLGAAGFTALVGVGVGLAVFWGWVPLWWVIPMVLVLTSAVMVLRTRPHGLEHGRRHVRQRAGGAEVALGAALAGWLTVAYGVAPGMSGRTALLLFAVAAALTGFGLATLRSEIRVHRP